ncbi:MAG TPA: M20/M25/M40 family metallo-hydrolase [Solirubrobacteraceae bacterium]|jgi:glutamate carboxypeptidase|nr:M20/M25/M40 family metallo-hydrolase [Solirubrobacteraceae bacterium]
MSASTLPATSAMAAEAEADLEALVAISSPSGDAAGAEAALALCIERLPPGAAIERVPCSSPDHAPDLLARVRGTGSGRVLLLGHVDTVVAHAEHLRLQRDGDTWRGSGAVDMKGGVALALALARWLAERPDSFAELAVLLVVDEEWRSERFSHVGRFAGYDACLCFEAAERTPAGEEGVVVRRKAAGTLRVTGHGRAAHAGSNPDAGANALLALAEVASAAVALHRPDGPAELSVVPTRISAGDAVNVVPADGELMIDTRAVSEAAFDTVIEAVASSAKAARVEVELIRSWPGMDTAQATRDVLEAASERLGREIVGVGRGGASDASHFAAAIPLTIDGLGPRGGHAHAPDEYVYGPSMFERAEVAIAIAEALLR